MPDKRNIRGGVRLASGYTDRHAALSFFMNNSTFSVLTNSSISCITLVATLNPDVASPYKSFRNVDFNAEVRKILLKVFITANEAGWFPTQTARGGYNGIEITSMNDFLNEINIQREIYRKSFFSKVSFLEPMCPKIINFHHCDTNTVNKFKSGLLNGLSGDEQMKLNEILDAHTLDRNISFVVMELMEGYKIAADIFKTKDATDKIVPNLASQTEPLLLDLFQYEFQRLNIYGYIHGDAHFGNVMIHPNYNYVYGGPNGRALIIDFGRTIFQGNIDPNIVNNTLERFRHEPWGISPTYLIDIQKFNQMYQSKFQSMQGFYNDFGNYLEANGSPLNGDRTYETIRSTLEGIINANPERYYIGGLNTGSRNLISAVAIRPQAHHTKLTPKALISRTRSPAKATAKVPEPVPGEETPAAFSESKKNPLFETKYKVFRKNLIAVFDDKTNGELKGPLFIQKKKNGGSKKRTKNKQRTIKRRKKKTRRRKR